MRSDSGSKMVRSGVASALKIGGAAYGGLVLSSESRTFASAADADTVRRLGIAGINCSWNRYASILYTENVLCYPYEHLLMV